MKIGDKVSPKPGHYIVCGSGYYESAVVMSVKPFIITSHASDMLWRREEAINFDVQGEADVDDVRRGLRRLSEEQIRVVLDQYAPFQSKKYKNLHEQGKLVLPCGPF